MAANSSSSLDVEVGSAGPMEPPPNHVGSNAAMPEESGQTYAPHIPWLETSAHSFLSLGYAPISPNHRASCPSCWVGTLARPDRTRFPSRRSSIETSFALNRNSPQRVIPSDSDSTIYEASRNSTCAASHLEEYRCVAVDSSRHYLRIARI